MDDSTEDPEQLAQIHSQWRWIADVLWLGFAMLLAVVGLVVWLITGNVNHFYGFLFYAIFPVIGLLHNHFILFRRSKDPVQTQRRLEKQYHKQQVNARKTSRFNGWMMLIAAPVIALVSVGEGAKEGMLQAVLGAAFSAAWAIAAWYSIRWESRGK